MLFSGPERLLKSMLTVNAGSWLAVSCSGKIVELDPFLGGSAKRWPLEEWVTSCRLKILSNSASRTSEKLPEVSSSFDGIRDVVIDSMVCIILVRCICP